MNSPGGGSQPGVGMSPGVSLSAKMVILGDRMAKRQEISQFRSE